MNKLIITNAQYYQEDGVNSSITATIGGVVWNVPIVVGNTDYDEIMRQVEAGTLTIQEAE